MDTTNNRLYKDKEIAIKLGALSSDLKQIPNNLQDDAKKALGDQDSVHVPRRSRSGHMGRLAQFAIRDRNNKAKRKVKNKMSKQSRRKNR